MGTLYDPHSTPSEYGNTMFLASDVCFADEDYNIGAEDEDFLEVSAKARANPHHESLRLGPGSSQVEIPTTKYIADSDYEDDDELCSSESSDDECKTNMRKKKVKDPEFNFERERYNPCFEVGMRFGSFSEFKEAVKNWGIKNRRQVFFPRNDKVRCQSRCYSEKKKPYQKCTFYIWASKVSKVDPTIQIKTLQLRHTCPMIFENFHLDSDWIARYYIDRFRADPTWHEDNITATVLADHGYKISHTKAWRVREKGLNWIYGEEEKQYEKLTGYGMDLKNTNPDSTVILRRDVGHFKGFYVCFGSLKEAYKRYLRPIICVDGCHLRGNYKGQILTAVGIDPNDCIFPIAICLVEDRESWTWFLSLVGEDLDIGSGKGISFMSDRQKGLIGAIKHLFPEAEHRNCVRHMYTNFRKSFKGKELKDLVWNAAKASYPKQFEQWMEKIECNDKEAREWFNHVDKPMESWSRVFFREEAKCDILLNNLCECFNAYILDTRKKAIITMLEMIKDRIMKRLFTKKLMADRWNQPICPKVAKKLEKTNLFSTLFIPSHNGHTKIRLDGGDGPHICDLAEKTCTCRRWQLTGLPCAHAMCAIRFKGDEIEDYVDDYYKVERYKKVYSIFINPTNNEDFWPNDPTLGIVIPPPAKPKKKGRPTTKRRMEAEELERAELEKKVEAYRKRMESRNNPTQTEQAIEPNIERTKLSKRGRGTVTCSLCRVQGHNKRYCTQRSVEPNSATRGENESMNVVVNGEASGNEQIAGNMDNLFVDGIFMDEGYGAVTQDIWRN